MRTTDVARDHACWKIADIPRPAGPPVAGRSDRVVRREGWEVVAESGGQSRWVRQGAERAWSEARARATTSQ